MSAHGALADGHFVTDPVECWRSISTNGSGAGYAEEVSSQSPMTSTAAEERIAELEAALASERERAEALAAEPTALEAERDQLREAYHQVKLELELLKRRLFGVKAGADQHRSARARSQAGSSGRPGASSRRGGRGQGAAADGPAPGPKEADRPSRSARGRPTRGADRDRRPDPGGGWPSGSAPRRAASWAGGARLRSGS